MLDEFPALGRLDFFETALAFMAGYGIRAYLISQSLNPTAERIHGDNTTVPVLAPMRAMTSPLAALIHLRRSGRRNGFSNRTKKLG